MGRYQFSFKGKHAIRGFDNLGTFLDFKLDKSFCLEPTRTFAVQNTISCNPSYALSFYSNVLFHACTHELIKV